jgi:hypothetical protein
LRYHFNIRDADGLLPDDEGSELTNMAAARAEARASAAEFAIDDLRTGGPIKARCIEITDPEGLVLESLMVRSIAGFNNG